MSSGLRHLKQDATYWAPSTTTDVNGKPVSSAPVVLKCRWEDKQEQIKAKSGEDVISKSRVFIDGNAIDIDLDGYIALGVRTDIDPSQSEDAFEIQALGKTPDLRSIRNLTVIYL